MSARTSSERMPSAWRAGEWTIVHRCGRCTAIRTNRIAGDDNELALMSLAVRPLGPHSYNMIFIAKKGTDPQ